jgi:hypothetical protein
VVARAPRPQVHPHGLQTIEPTIGVTRRGSVLANAIKCAGAGLPEPVTLRSTDDGAHFTDVSHRLPGGAIAHGITQDPYLYVDHRTDRLFTSDINNLPCPSVGVSADEGATWSETVACGLTDHQNIFTGPPPKAGPKPAGYADVVYYCSIDGGAEAGFSKATSCLKSLDGGVTFDRTGDPAYQVAPDQAAEESPLRCDGGTGPGFVDDAGTVYLPRGFCGDPTLAISRDEGKTWTRVKVSGKALATQLLSLGTPGGGQVRVWNHEAGVVADGRGLVYYTWVAGADRLPYLAVSRDGGKTFGPAQMIAPPGITQAWNPAIDIGDDGRLVIAWIGSTDAPRPPFEVPGQPNATPTEAEGPDYSKVTWNGYMTVVPDASDPRPLIYTASVNDPADPFLKGACDAVRCGAEFDFIDVVAAPDGTAWASFADACAPADKPEECYGIGAGVAAHLVAGPPLAGTVADQAPSITLPSRTCASRRRFTIRLREPRRGHLVRATVSVDGRRVRVVRGERLRAGVDLRGLPRRAYVVRVVARTNTGRTLVRTRRYRTCTPRGTR